MNAPGETLWLSTVKPRILELSFVHSDKAVSALRLDGILVDGNISERYAEVQQSVVMSKENSDVGV